MMFSIKIAVFIVSILQVASAVPTSSYVNWTTFKASGVNLGGWLEQESTIDTAFWAEYGGNATDEWGLCVHLGSQCGPVLERRYATFITPSDIDILAAAGVTILRIPTMYAAWVKVPGSQLPALLGLPGGVNGMAFGEATGHYGWFNNATALAYSYEAIEAVIAYVQGSGFPQSYTVEPINEPVDNIDLEDFGTPAALSASGAAWVLQYLQGVIARVRAANPKIPTMFQGSFKGEAYWSPSFPAGTNLVFDVHNYYFAGRPTDSLNVSARICSDAKTSVGDGKFPVFIGEWSIQTVSDNLFSTHAMSLNTGLYAFVKYDHGSAYWTAKFTGDAAVVGQGVQSDYWSYENFISLGYIDPSSGAAYCP